ncbi:hypothetical protein AVV36_gp120 [Pectobacterium bacteriophage PM2]|uniref:Uncharacterized protein n=1 Tax=Pectobacterium bacteriophage PM2 TaxID=1429794 RepID=A0A0A0Q3G0_9CAUD|nr:hypothetical protein AVV36_gp120 [Pectobacterium bacteriophage PM2]AHY25082.1 hypothetical protein PM2_120 [Pectobacterium bacteriophage PM2]
MSDEEQYYVIEQLEILIKLAKAVGALASHGTEDEYCKAVVKLENQKRHILSMNGIEIL